MGNETGIANVREARHQITSAAMLLGACLMVSPTIAAPHAVPQTAPQITTATAPCANPAWASRTVIVPANVQNYGTMQYQQTVALADKEVVLTFDDGPNVDTTLSILDTLDDYCVKATFFFTGLRADRYPELVREAALRGHTIASHTYSHPNNLRRIGWNSAVRQIRRGISSVQAALDGDPATSDMSVAPFFRFPGLNHSRGLRGWLASQNISTFSCDIGSDDWRRISSRSVIYRALRNIRSKRGGIIIFHDTKTRTATALPAILEQLQAEGYHIAHMVPEVTNQAVIAGNPTLAPQSGLSVH
ncbi:MAG: hypothetical protein COA62_09500 [Rhodobiaceae bacterium]|nr:MAG: hypothetical protein COA62_09500 [Rhodobiaceae bacterium]